LLKAKQQNGQFCYDQYLSFIILMDFKRPSWSISNTKRYLILTSPLRDNIFYEFMNTKIPIFPVSALNLIGGSPTGKINLCPLFPSKHNLHNSSNAIILRSLLFPDYEPPTAAVPKPNYMDRNKGTDPIRSHNLWTICVLYKKWCT